MDCAGLNGSSWPDADFATAGTNFRAGGIVKARVAYADEYDLTSRRCTKLRKHLGERIRLHLHHAGKGPIDNNDDQEPREDQR